MHTKEKLLYQDLESILALLGRDIETLRGKSLFITGGTGFLGRWILETMHYANQKLRAEVHVTVLSRNPESFTQKAPHLATSPYFKLVRGDVRSFDLPEDIYDFIIHAAADSSSETNMNQPLIMVETIVEGTRRMLEFALQCQAKSFLFVSSGAVYGPQPRSMSHISESFLGAPDMCSPDAAYAEGKRMAETLCSIYARQFDLNIKIARCFAFIGPFLDLNGRFAAGNFIRDLIAGKSIKVRGDGTALRSYLYAADLVVWLLKILLNGKPAYPYNVGSDEAVSIKQLAEKIAATVDPSRQIEIAQKPLADVLPERYIPDVARAVKDLGLGRTYGLNEAIARTIKWNTE